MYTELRLMIADTIRVDSRGQWAKKRISDQVGQSQLQRMHHTKTRRLPIAASMIFDKLPSNWVNRRLQGQCQSPYIHQSRVTGNAEVVHSPEAVCELHVIHVDPHRKQQLKLRSPSRWLDGVIYLMDAARNSSSGYATILLQLPIWLPVSLVFRRSEFKIVEQRSQIMWQLWMGSTITPECSKVASRYNSQLPLSIVTLGTCLDDRIGLLWGESHLHQLYSILSNKSTKADQSPMSEYGYVLIRWHMKRVFRDTMEMIFIL